MVATLIGLQLFHWRFFGKLSSVQLEILKAISNIKLHNIACQQIRTHSHGYRHNFLNYASSGFMSLILI